MTFCATGPLSNKRSNREKKRNLTWRFLRGLCFFSFFFDRYRIGDIVKVVGFHNQCPIVEFQYRYIMTHTC